MTERRTESPDRGSRCAVVEGNEMSATNAPAAAPAIKIAAEVVDLVRGSLVPSSVGRDSVAFYTEALRRVGIEDPNSLSFAEVVEVTRRLYAPSAEFRKSAREVRAIERAKAEEAAKAEREAKVKLELIAKKAKLQAAIDAIS